MSKFFFSAHACLDDVPAAAWQIMPLRAKNERSCILAINIESHNEAVDSDLW
jgi:hypothetical protein